MFKRVMTLRDVANLRLPLSGKGYCYVTASSRRVKVFYVLKKDRIFVRKSPLVCCKKHRIALKRTKLRLHRRRSVMDLWGSTVGPKNCTEGREIICLAGKNSNDKRIERNKDKKEDTFKLKTLKQMRSIENHLIAQNKLLANLVENAPLKCLSEEPLNNVPHRCDCVKESFCRRLFWCFS